MENMTQKAGRMAQAAARRPWWRRVAIPAMLVTLIAVYGLSVSAMDADAPTYCGMTEHVHNADCYTGQLACGYETGSPVPTEVEGETIPHEHTEACYVRTLSCTTAEHTHTPECYISPEPTPTPTPLCGLEEHTHTAECYASPEEVVCGKAAHTHTAECYAARPDAAPAEQGDGAAEDAQTEEVVEIEEEPTTGTDNITVKMFRDSQVAVTASYRADAALPQDVELLAYPITAKSDPETWRNYVLEALRAVSVDGSIDPDLMASVNAGVAPLPMVIYDIGFYLNGEEVEPQAPVTVKMQFLDENGFAVGESATVLHFAQGGTENLDNAPVSGENSTTFETDSFSPFVFSAAPGLTGATGHMRKNVAIIASDPSKNTVSLQDLLTGLTITDKNGKELGNGDTLNVGDDYTLTLNFKEKTGGTQFDPDKPMTYEIPEPLVLRDMEAHTEEFKTEPDNKTISYTYWVKDNTLYLQFADEESKRLVGSYTNVGVGLNLQAELTSDGGTEFDIPVKDGGSIHVHVDRDPKPKLSKTAHYDASNQCVEYEVEVEAKNGPLENLRFDDKLKSDPRLLEYHYPLDYTVEEYNENGELVGSYPTEDGKNWGEVTTHESNNFVIKNGGDLAEGHRLVLRYKAYLRDEYKTQNKFSSDEKNRARLTTGPDGKRTDTEVTVTEKVVKNDLGKEGKVTEIDGEKVIKWTVQIGDGTKDDFLGKHLTDKLSAGQTYFEGKGVQVTVHGYNEETGSYVPYADYTVAFGEETGNADTHHNSTDMELWLPSKEWLTEGKDAHLGDPNDAGIYTWTQKPEGEFPEHCYITVTYYTKYTVPESELVHTFSNDVNVKLDDDKDMSTTGQVQVQGPGETDITKTVENEAFVAENGYVEYKVEFEMPVYNDPMDAKNQYKTYFRIKDLLTLRDGNAEYAYVENDPQELQVTLTYEDGTSVTLENHDDSWYKNGRKINDNAWLLRTYDMERTPDGVHTKADHTEVNYFYLVFNTDDRYAGEYGSYLYLQQSATLKITYKISLDAKVYKGQGADKVPVGESIGTLGDLLKEGYTLNNKTEGQFNNFRDVDDDVNYSSPEHASSVVKNGKVLENGILAYSVDFKNWDPANTKQPYLNQGDGGRDAEKLVFRDTFENTYLSYVSGSLYAEVWRCRSSGGYEASGRYQYVGEPKITVNSDGTTTIEAPATGFTNRVAFENGETTDNEGFGDWWTSDNNKTLTKAVNRHTEAGDSDTEANIIRFVYQLKVSDDVKNLPQSSLTFHNHAEVQPGNETPMGAEKDLEYKTGVLDKTGKQHTDGNLIDFEVTFNPNHIQILPDESTDTTLTLYDEASENLIILGATLKATADYGDGEGAQDITGQLKITWPTPNCMRIEGVPDKAVIHITYQATIDTNKPGNFEVSNNIKVENAKGYEDGFKQEFEVKQVQGTGTAGFGSVKLTKYDPETEEALAGAKFLLYFINEADPYEGGGTRPTLPTDLPEELKGQAQETMTIDGEKAWFIGAYEVGDNGSVIIENTLFGDDGLEFVIVEYKAPEGYDLPTGDAAQTHFTFYYKDMPEKITDGIVVSGGNVNVPNTKSYTVELPESGGTGTAAHTAGGVGLLALAGWLLYRRRTAR